MKEIILNQQFEAGRPKGYISPTHLTTEAEIKNWCNENKIVVASIKAYEGYSIIGKKVRSKKSCLEYQKVLDETS